MKVIFHEDFFQVYTSDPAASAGRMEAVVEAIKSEVEFITAEPASEADIALVHRASHIKRVRQMGLYDISALAAGGAIQAARIGLTEACFGLIRPPGHHASPGSSWGFCYFNNMAIALEVLKQEGKIDTAFVLDIDLHFGDGTANALENKDDMSVYNVEASVRSMYLEQIENELSCCRADMIGVSAGFDNHRKDWGGLLHTRDYWEIGRMLRSHIKRCNSGCFAILEGGYNHEVLGQNVSALIRGLSGVAAD